MPTGPSEATSTVRDSDAGLLLPKTLPAARQSLPLPMPAVLDALPHFTALLSPEAAIRFVNAPALAAIGRSLAALEGEPLWLTPWWDFDPQAQGQVRLACARARLGETVRLQVPMRGSTGPPDVVALTIVPLWERDGDLRQLVVSALEPTDHGASDADLQARYRRKDEFLAMLAHELRNPLAPLRNAAAMLRLTDDGQPQRKAISALVDRQVGHMSRLLDDLLDASRIDQGKIVLSLEPVELGNLLAQALEGARALTDARGQQVDYTPVDVDAAPSQAKRVMVVDDNVDAAESLAELLALKGHQARAVTEPRAALEMAPDFAPEVVLLDIGLPEIDGFEVARMLRQMPCTRHSLLVAVTGYGQAEDRKASSAAGFDHHLVKPVSLRQIEELIARRH